ncbi:3-oxoacyl-[acyl-carrier-protein] synthase III C-terminal domain-containing protein [Streptomyces sp. NPDC058256]|uniref:3-oxoacyl-[acyl-carrier-protein] synthase III C-terminal domain-containing protein n=1 Tax=Streptomyces sp. NPDC058256 TaxID=3346408 RepID=UPI0036EBC732
MLTAPSPFPYAVTGAHTTLGPVITMDAWAKLAQVPNRREPGSTLDGSFITRLLGIEGKSWGPDQFATPEAVAETARAALASARLDADDITAVVVVTCNPYQTLLDQDAFTLMRMLGIGDHVLPLQLGAGCAGLARAAALVAQLATERALVIAYSVPSRISFDEDGVMLPAYRDNAVHPYGRNLWASPALFSDAAAAMVLERDEDIDGLVLYSRDSQSFGDEPGVDDPLIHFLGGGTERPGGAQGSAELACFGMNAPEIGRYYSGGMMLNHQALEAARPGYLDEVHRVYTHQANPRLVEEFSRETGLTTEQAPSNVRQLGNTVSPSTLALLHADQVNGNLTYGDRACFSVVGSGPERGAFITPIRIPALQSLESVSA